MAVPRWKPPVEISKREERVMRRLKRTGKLFAFLRQQRHAIFDDAFQDELAAVYRDSDEGKQPIAPALMAMATLIQAYAGVSDAEAVERAAFDVRWQMVLGVLGEDEPPFSQGTSSTTSIVGSWSARSSSLARPRDSTARSSPRRCGWPSTPGLCPAQAVSRTR
jgi:hypothetical protein